MASASPVVSEIKTQPETKSQKGAATRDQILNAASRLIHVQGYQSTSLDDVLRESGVGKGNFYYYFKSKEDLGYAIIDRIRRAFIERGLGPAFADTDADPVGQLHAFFDRVLDSQRQRNCVGGLRDGQSRVRALRRARGLPPAARRHLRRLPRPSRGGDPARPAERRAPRRTRTPRGWPSSSWADSKAPFSWERSRETSRSSNDASRS